jgi:hypothetical protein
MNAFAIAVQGIGLGVLLVASQGLGFASEVVSVEQNSGGYFNTPKRSKEDKERDIRRIEQQIEGKLTRRQTKKIAAKAVEVVYKEPIVNYYRKDVDDLTKALMRELRTTVELPNYAASIQIAIAARIAEDEEEILLLMI